MEFIKLHIAADAKSKKVASFRVIRGNVHDAKKFSPLVREASKKYNIDKVYADKAHDNRRNFNLLESLDVEPIIAMRNNATTRERGCHLRRTPTVPALPHPGLLITDGHVVGDAKVVVQHFSIAIDILKVIASDIYSR